MAFSGEWRSISCRKQQLRLEVILTNGQSFRWWSLSLQMCFVCKWILFHSRIEHGKNVRSSRWTRAIRVSWTRWASGIGIILKDAKNKSIHFSLSSIIFLNRLLNCAFVSSLNFKRICSEQRPRDCLGVCNLLISCMSEYFCFRSECLLYVIIGSYLLIIQLTSVLLWASCGKVLYTCLLVVVVSSVCYGLSFLFQELCFPEGESANVKRKSRFLNLRSVKKKVLGKF